jgi:hypothetical protein
MLTTTPISTRFANERILHAIQGVTDARLRAGLTRLDARLVREGIPPGLRLHVIAAVKQLSRDSAQTRHDRYLRAVESIGSEDDD